jgi:transposase
MSLISLRQTIVTLHREGKSNREICDLLKQCKASMRLIQRTLKRYKETGDVVDKCRSGRPRSVRTKQCIKRIRSKLARKVRRSANKLAVEEKCSRQTMQTILKEDLGCYPFKRARNKMSASGGWKTRLAKCKSLKSRLANVDPNSIIHFDEKIFVVTEKFNSQNDRIWTVNLSTVSDQDLYVFKPQKPQSLMVAAAICGRGKSPLIFVDRGVKINQKYYEEHILQSHILPWIQATFGDDYYLWVQDSAPSHKANKTQAFCSAKSVDFLTDKEWPAGSPELNALDYYAWSRLEQLVNNKTYPNLDSLKAALVKAWNDLPQEEVVSATCHFPKRVGYMIKTKGGSIHKRYVK